MPFVNASSTVRVSIATSGLAGNGASHSSSMSANGRFIAFSSTASSLSSLDGNGEQDIYLRDLLTGTTTLVSVGIGGLAANDGSAIASVTDDGRFVAFYTSATDIIPGDDPTFDVVVRDMWSGTTTRISQNGAGFAGNGNSTIFRITEDGAFVLFNSSANNLVTGDTNGQSDVFLRDMMSGELTLVSVSSAEVQANGPAAFSADISNDGRFVAMSGEATNLVGGDTNGSADIFLRDTLLGTTKRLSVSSTGTQGNGPSYAPSISADGRYVVFDSEATNLVSGDTNGSQDTFVRDTVLNTTRRISVSSEGAQANAGAFGGQISDSGRYVVFSSMATNLVANDTNGMADIFLRDLLKGTTTRLSIGLNGVQANGGSYFPTISSDGRCVSFSSDASNIVPGDLNAQTDIFRVSLFATSQADNLIGSDTKDTIAGGGGSDRILGGLDNDALSGGSGNDTLDGGGDQDVLVGGIGADRHIGSTGNDTASYAGATSAVRVSLASPLTNTGEAAGDTYSSVENVTGSRFSDQLTGSSAANILVAGSGNDVLTGGAGLDSLSGNSGNDFFVFSAPLSSAHRDTVKDFANASGNNDSIRLENAVMTKLGAVGTLNAAFFRAGAAAADANDYIIYDKATGALSYDANGNVAGGVTLLATLTNKPTLTAADIFVM